jgi:hypothetical protein
VLQDFWDHNPFSDLVDKLASHPQVDIRFKQGQPEFPEPVFNFLFAEPTSPSPSGKKVLKPFGQTLPHFHAPPKGQV